MNHLLTDEKGGLQIMNYNENETMMKWTDLSNEILFSRIMLDRNSLGWLFKDLLPGEYMLLVITGKMEKAYLRSLEYLTKYNMPSISKLAGRLKNKGLVIWTHDGDGSEGTYLMLTKAGEERLREMEELTAKYYARVIDQFGEDKLREFTSMARRIAELLKEEMSEREVPEDDEP